MCVCEIWQKQKEGKEQRMERNKIEQDVGVFTEIDTVVNQIYYRKFLHNVRQCNGHAKKRFKNYSPGCY